MKPNEKPAGIWNPVRPGPRAALRRLLLITSVLFPLSWVIYAFLVKSWNPLEPTEEFARHFADWLVTLAVAVDVVFLASLLPGIRGLLSWRAFRRLFFGVAMLVTLIALFYAEENWRGKRAWDNYRREREAQGDKFDRQHFIPPPVPDDQNFAQTPYLAPLFDFKPGTQQFRDPKWHLKYEEVALQSFMLEWKTPPEQARVNSWVRSRRDLPAWFATIIEMDNSMNTQFKLGKPKETILTNATPQMLAASVLAARTPAKAKLDEILAASARPHSRFNIRYENDDPASILLPHLGILKGLTMFLQIRASAALTLDHVADASIDINLMFYLTDATRSEPTLICQLVRFSELEFALQPIAQGIETHQWSDSQLQAFQQRLEAFDFCADTKHAMAAERAFFGGGVLSYFRQLGSRERSRYFDAISQWPVSERTYPPLQHPYSPWATYYAGVVPTGWYFLEQINYDEAYRNYIKSVIDVDGQVINPSHARKANENLELARSPDHPLSSHRVFSNLLLPALSNITEKTARAQTAANLAAIACALERYRLAHGKFPPTLEALRPQFMRKLPHDVINGQPLHYRLTNDGQFVLYSVGWNEKDDGGAIGWRNQQTVDWQNGSGGGGGVAVGTAAGRNRQIIDWNSGDWVWAYPAR